jgi:hypothetical protein
VLAVYTHLPGKQSKAFRPKAAQHRSRPHHGQDVEDICIAAWSLHDIAIKNARLVQLHKSHFLCFQNDFLAHHVIITTTTTIIIIIIICNIKLTIRWILMEKM